jgi:methionine-rich copper-binding protein CopC/putative copper export protein
MISTAVSPTSCAATRCARSVLLLLLILLAPVSRASAHQRLLGSAPARGEVVHTAPRELRLTFHQATEPTFTRVALIGPDGEVALGAPGLKPDSATVLLVPITGALKAGAYTVRWSTASRDGHPVHGEYGFTIAEDAAGLVAEVVGGAGAALAQPNVPTAQEPTPSAPKAHVEAAFNAESPSYVAIRWVGYAALLGVVGVAAFALLVLGAVKRRAGADDEVLIRDARGRAAALGLGFVVLLLASALARLYAQTLALYGTVALDPAQVDAMLARTVWGWGWLLQVAAGLVAGVGLLRARRGRGGGWGVVGVATLALAITPALSGHAASMSGRIGALAVMVDWLHVLAAGGWLGGLLALLAAGVPSALELGSARRGHAVATLVHAFSPTALLFATLLVLSGATATVIHGGSIAAFLGSRYGALLGIKLAVVLLVAATGAYNFLRVKPVLGDDAATVRLRRSATVEVAVGAVVLLITAVLVATARPAADEASGSAADASPAVHVG